MELTLSLFVFIVLSIFVVVLLEKFENIEMQLRDIKSKLHNLQSDVYDKHLLCSTMNKQLSEFNHQLSNIHNSIQRCCK